MRRQCGQSLAEFAVALTVLSLLLLGTVAIAGYQEVDRRLAFAARELQFQSAWRGGRAPSAQDLDLAHAQHLQDPGVRELTGRPLAIARESLVFDARAVVPEGPAGLATQLLLAPLQAGGSLLGTGFDLQRGGLVQGHLRTRVAPMLGMPVPFSQLDLAFAAPLGVLADAWHAAGASHVRARAAGLVPSGGLRELAAAWRPLTAPLALFEPSLRRFCPGLIEPDRVPEDRLGPGTSPLPGDCP